MNITQLKTFIEVYKLKHVSRAAESLHLTQPAVTLHLKKLEKEFGSVLFQRRRFQFLPTHCGDILYSHARQILKQLEDAKNEIRFACEGISGTLRVSASTAPGEFLVPDILSRFVKKYPRVQVEIFVMDSDGVLRCLHKKQCDFGFVGVLQKMPGFQFIKFAEDEIVLACPKNFKLGKRKGFISLNELKDVSFVMREEGSGTMKSVRELLRKHKLSLPLHHVAAVIESSHAQLSAIEAGLGVGFVSSLALRRKNKDSGVRALRLHGVMLMRPLYMVYEKEKLEAKLYAEFARFVVLFSKSRSGRRKLKA